MIYEKHSVIHGAAPDQPLPTKNDLPSIQDLVIEDIAERKKIGIERYGTPLQPWNGRDALVDAYQESLDLTMYLRQVIYELDHPRQKPSEHDEQNVHPVALQPMTKEELAPFIDWYQQVIVEKK